MRTAIGGLMQETNSFSPVGTVLADFEAEYLLRGNEIPEYFAGTNTEIAGFLSACESAGAQAAPLFAAAANSGGNVTAETFATLSGELLGSLRQATAEAPLDVLLLALHGSMCVDGEDDPEGTLLDSCRSIVGPKCVIGASLDLHANVTERMVRAADVLVGYRTYPHVDQASTAQRAANAAMAAVAGPRVRTVLQKLPLIVPAEHMQTTDGPMHELRTQADSLETEGLAAAVSVFGVQPWLDFPGVGCSVTVVGDGEAAARGHARRLASEFWRRRDRFAVELIDIERAVRAALETDGGPVVLVDSADCPSSGAPGDSVAVLAALLGHAGTDADLGGQCLMTVVDAETAAAAHRAGAGGRIDATVGGKLDPARSKGGSVCRSRRAPDRREIRSKRPRVHRPAARGRSDRRPGLWFDTRFGYVEARADKRPGAVQVGRVGAGPCQDRLHQIADSVPRGIRPVFAADYLRRYARGGQRESAGSFPGRKFRDRSTRSTISTGNPKREMTL